ncbi:MAG: DUF5107 domain-containing protein, partial [Victivallaceae bacterium]|nr:DUF5107 domain-containing protein [Victivallaceae bacterium]
MKAELIEIVIPTYRRGEDNPYPPLDFGEKTRYKPYPYYLQDDVDIGDLKYVPDKKYRAVILANGILEAIILPEMNGRVYSLRNLKSGREIFYRNNVVKPALAALRGAWISGGIEFNAPTLGHSVSAVSPVFRHIESNKAEAAVIIGDVDRSTGIRWQVRISLKKDRAALDIETQISNPNKYRERLYYWENAAVPAGDDLRFICNSDWTTGTFIMPWPFQDGVDRSWYLNNDLPVDHFCYRTYADFFGAHYSEKQCGTYHIGLRHETAGQKYFSWGRREDNRIWESYLTDSDGQYVELQSGVLESQFVTGWLDAGKEVCFSGSWFGVENIGELTWANKHAAAALNIDGDNFTIDMASLDLDGEFLVRIMSKGNEIPDKRIKLTPGENSKIAFKGTDEFEILLYSKTNRLLFQESWRRPGETDSKPETVPHNWSIDSASSPEWNKIEELEKYHYWNSALEETERIGKKMPPGQKDAALAEIFLKTGRPEKALKHLDRALNLRPGDSGLHLLAAAAALRMFREENKPEFLWRINDHCQASRSSGVLGKTALLILAETALLQGRLINARNILESLLKHNPKCPETLTLLAGTARKCGDTAAAEEAVSRIPDLWPQKAGETFLLHRKPAALKNIL